MVLWLILPILVPEIVRRYKHISGENLGDLILIEFPRKVLVTQEAGYFHAFSIMIPLIVIDFKLLEYM